MMTREYRVPRRRGGGPGRAPTTSDRPPGTGRTPARLIAVVADRARPTVRQAYGTAQASDPHLSQRVPELIRAHLRLSAEVVCVPTLPDGPTIDDQATGPNPARRPPCGYRSPRRNG